MKNASVLSRFSLKSIIGGVKDVCEGKTGVELETCRYNVCMSGWDSSVHNDRENENKVKSCAAASGIS